MRIPRIHHPERLIVGSQFALSDDAANHVGRVLRMTAGQHLQLFDGSNGCLTRSSPRPVRKRYG